MATATSASTSSTTTSSGQGADDNYAATGQSTDSGADGQGTADTMAGDPQSQAPAPAAAADPGGDDHRSSEPLRAERRKGGGRCTGLCPTTASPASAALAFSGGLKESQCAWVSLRRAIQCALSRKFARAGVVDGGWYAWFWTRPRWARREGAALREKRK